MVLIPPRSEISFCGTRTFSHSLCLWEHDRSDTHNNTLHSMLIIWCNFYVYMQNSGAPNKPCTKQNEAESVYSSDNSAEIWICSNKVWKPFG